MASPRRAVDENYVTVEGMEDIGSAEGDRRWNDVKDFLDRNNIGNRDSIDFVNKYAARSSGGDFFEFDTLQEYQAFVDAGKGTWVGGFEKGGNITMYRNAVASHIGAYRHNTSPLSGTWMKISATSVDAGVFVAGHELGHIGTSSWSGPTLQGEIEANIYGGNLLRMYRGGK